MDPTENLMKNKEDTFFPENYMCDKGTFLPKILGDLRCHLKAIFRREGLTFWFTEITISTNLSLVHASI